ncbi:UDP-3-O-(3-hydroxymyristoyl)glucosamine N-acyltransferase [bacterium]|nr:UDP-3-O-(3-hydroxymyristoyl)glucosamine N-acyltransferase [bacterium]
MQIIAADIAALVDGILDGSPDTLITGAAGVDDAEVGDVVLAEDAKYFAKAISSDAGCIIARTDSGCAPGKCLIRAADPVEAFIKVLEVFKGGEECPSPGIGCGAVIEQGALLGKDVAIGANCFVGRGTSLGDGCVLYPGVYIARDVTIGEGCVLHPGVVVYSKCTLGKHVILHAGVVIGADGFGYKPSPRGLMKFPHIGTVEIGDDVEIGANSTVDRAKTGVTVIGSGTKIDNLVHIAHNVKVGAHCVIVAQSGVAGSVEIGSGVVLAAQVGVKDHVHIADGAKVAARAGVIGNVEQGAVVSGFPARDHRAEMRVQAARLHLPEIMTRLRDLENEVARLSGECAVDECAED